MTSDHEIDARPADAVVVPLRRPQPSGDAVPETGVARPAGRPPPRTSSSVLMAAMLGLADAMGFERPRTEMVTMAAAEPTEGDALIIGFGPLDPLD